jgi:DNA-binding transcriptional MocR family regulator
MSYRVDLSDLERAVETSITQQIAKRFAAAIESGALEAGVRLPSTRTIAADAGVNHLTAVRAIRHLAASGHVTSVPRSGTFVRRARRGTEDWQLSAMPPRPVTADRELEQQSVSRSSEVLSLAVGWPADDLAPSAQLRLHGIAVLNERMDAVTSYGDPAGCTELREALVRRGFSEDLVVTSGASQALHLAVRALVEPGDVVAVESPTYVGLLEVLRQSGARVVGIPVDEDGLRTDVLARLVRRRDVKLCALQPEHHNPTGVSTVAHRRRQLAELAVERNMFLLDDGVYADLGFTESAVPSLRSLAPDHVVQVGSLSKSVAGGLRVGWADARGPVARRIGAHKIMADFHTSTLPQLIAARFLDSGDFDEHLVRVRAAYQLRARALLGALDRHLPGEYTCPTPAGGHHVWLSFRAAISESLLYNECLRSGVLYTRPGALLATDPGAVSIRLSYCHLSPDDLDEAVRRLAQAYRRIR